MCGGPSDEGTAIFGRVHGMPKVSFGLIILIPIFEMNFVNIGL